MISRKAYWVLTVAVVLAFVIYTAVAGFNWSKTGWLLFSLAAVYVAYRPPMLSKDRNQKPN